MDTQLTHNDYMLIEVKPQIQNLPTTTIKQTAQWVLYHRGSPGLWAKPYLQKSIEVGPILSLWG